MTPARSWAGREFRPLGTWAPPSPAASRRWFVTAHTCRFETHCGGPRLSPVSTRHAKHMGTGLTACGLGTSSWRKLWDVAFDPEDAESCATCTAVVRSEAARLQLAVTVPPAS